jgi:DUF1707 SHOCT-like domain
MPMADNAKTRASDADRDQTAAALREHLASGRLTIEEFDQRLDQAYAVSPAAEEPQAFRPRGQAVTARQPDELVSIRDE